MSKEEKKIMKQSQIKGVSIFSIVVLFLTGCAATDEGSIWRSGATTVESRRWVGAQIDAILNASGTTASWKNYEGSSPHEWAGGSETRAEFLDGLGIGYCGKQTPEDVEGNQAQVLLKNSDAGNGAPVVALRVAALLVSAGWDVHVSPVIENSNWTVRATRPDQARAVFGAFPHGLSLSVEAPCSSMPYDYGGIDRDTVPSVLDPVVKDFRRLPSTKEERAAWSPMQRDSEEEQQSFELEEEPK